MAFSSRFAWKLQLISALLCEQSDEWLTSKIYLNMNPAHPPHF